jgi:flavin-binding protein dodecin
MLPGVFTRYVRIYMRSCQFRLSGERCAQPPARRGSHADKTYKIVEVVGVSDGSIHEAVRNAITKASQTLHNIDWFEVTHVRGAVHGSNIEFQVEVRIGFRLEGNPV